MYSMYGSGHRLSFEHKATTLPALVLSNVSAILSKGGRVLLNHFDLNEWILAAGIFFFSPFPHQSYINRLFLQGISTSHRYGIPSVTGVESKQELKHDSVI